jgi:hypothetical protein
LCVEKSNHIPKCALKFIEKHIGVFLVARWSKNVIGCPSKPAKSEFLESVQLTECLSLPFNWLGYSKY